MRWRFAGAPRGRRTGRGAGAAALAATVLLATGCGGLSGWPAPEASGGSLAARGIDLHGQTYTVGGKEFDEQLVLCKMTIAALQSVGATVHDRCRITGTATTRAALITGQIDMYWEYTGTGWITLLNHAVPIPGSQAQYVAVRDEDRAENHIVWLPPSPFNDTYAIATRRGFARQNHLRTITDWANLVSSGDPAATTCVEAEFARRVDGLAGLFRAYGVTDPPQGPPTLTTLDTGAVYQATASGSPCNFGEVFTTDGRIPGLDLVTLVDDRNYFPTYNASPTIREQVFDRDPAIRRVFDAITPRLTDPVMLDLNGQVSSQGRDPARVARNWLRRNGFIGG